MASGKTNMYSSSKRRFLSCLICLDGCVFHVFFELGSLTPGCYEGLSHMSSSGSNCGNDRRHDERVQAREKLLQQLALLDGMTKRDGNRGLGQRKIDWHLIDSAGGESKAMTYEVCLILRVCCCTAFLQMNAVSTFRSEIGQSEGWLDGSSINS